MSLYEKADGILETHVTWDDVEKHLQKNLETKATFGKKKTATNISDMKGFMSRIALIQPDWNNVENGKVLPEKLIVKRFNHPNVPYTKVYALKSFDSESDLKGYFVAEFVPNVHTIGMFRPIPADELESLVRGIGTFSALCEKLEPEEKTFAGGEDYLEMVFKDFFDEEKLKNTFAQLKEVLGKQNEVNADKLINIYWHYFKLVPKYSHISRLLGFKKVLNHGDLWQSNMLHSLDKDGKMKLEAMIDWQGCAIVSPGLDTSRLLMGCLSTKDYRESAQRLLEIYHRSFTETYGKELFTFQELLNAYKLFFPMAAMLIQPGMLPFLNKADIPEPEKSEVEKSVMNKIVGVMEDMFEIHEHNLSRFPDFMKL